VKTAELGRETFTIEPIDNSVVFLKQEDIVLTDDAWHVTAELNVNPYEEAVLTIRNDLRVCTRVKKRLPL